MNIVYSTDAYLPRISGLTISIETFRKELGKLGHNVYVFAPNYPQPKKKYEEWNDKNVFCFASWREFFFKKEDRLVFPFEKAKVFKILDSIKPDIIHVQTEFIMGRLAWQYAIKNRIPFHFLFLSFCY